MIHLDTFHMSKLIYCLFIYLASRWELGACSSYSKIYETIIFNVP